SKPQTRAAHHIPLLSSDGPLLPQALRRPVPSVRDRGGPNGHLRGARGGGLSHPGNQPIRAARRPVTGLVRNVSGLRALYVLALIVSDLIMLRLAFVLAY